MFDPKLDKTRSQMLYANRGAAFWTRREKKRLYYGTLDGQLWAINADNGKPVTASEKEVLSTCGRHGRSRG